MTDQENEPKTLAERIDASGQQEYRKKFAWKAWREAWNVRGSTDSMDELKERTARNAFERWWDKDA